MQRPQQKEQPRVNADNASATDITMQWILRNILKKIHMKLQTKYIWYDYLRQKKSVFSPGGHLFNWYENFFENKQKERIFIDDQFKTYISSTVLRIKSHLYVWSVDLILLVHA